MGIKSWENKKFGVDFYNLDAIIAVGYRVNSCEATQFQIWATNTLREFIIKGFVLDDERLKQGKHFGQDYFEQLVSAYLDLAENRAKRQILMNMAEWETFLNNFLMLSNYPILQDHSKISAEMAKIKAESEYDKFRVIQDRPFKSDFNRFLEEAEKIQS
ncbi:hypothetical protein EIM44_04545 [Bibersteinia trehalosi]|uniref:Cell filamentation protein Fic n=1 Tax=Bibersteinia trehalosi TaxID=47735 RepID=A0A3R8LE77_BIBTR|nr:RhuM family protein [Bibersteinia trehalosi]RRN04713.1 hypothetical protein EIM44_04545 [Bibersteinia trehalosi]